jgi:ribonuclease HII
MDSFTDIELDSMRMGVRLIAGVDEAGRGPLAGPVVAAAVIFPAGAVVKGVADSKKLSPASRCALRERIFEAAVTVGVGIATHEEIDSINILQASLLAMRRAVEQLSLQPDLALVDGNRLPGLACPTRAIVKGDALCFSIAAASIIAKEHRDAIMIELDREYPEWDFARHKGYPTPQHRAAIAAHGLSPVHRRTFATGPEWRNSSIG